ncbi:MAG: FAD-binding oxidoreductase [Candidatus Hydrogenedentes bacterium]|nr:FAD-binding oxidoreductase [Candidatus Hydrogenedentota bacterium]
MRSAEAIRVWRELLGLDRCRDDAAAVEQYARSMQPNAPAPCCVLYARSTEEVQEIVRVAARYETPLYPLSRGKNWGYGDACVLRAGAVILDLSRMDRVLEINRELAYAVIEPGVSQHQLYSTLQTQAPELWMDSTGAGYDASVVGNALDRGFGHTPYGDHSRTTCALEVVLADGSLLHTGFTHYPQARAGQVFPHGVGPSLNELFTQTNFGIVTRLTLWLSPKPEAFACFYLLAEREDALVPVVDALRPLRLQGVLNSAVHVGNDLRILSSQRGYPWAQTGGRTPLPSAVREQLRLEAGLGAWNLTGSLSGTPEHVRGAAARVRRALSPLGKLVFVDDRKLQLATKAVRLLQRFGAAKTLARKLEALVPNYGLLKGIPTNEPLRGVYWRLRQPPPVPSEDPLETPAGLYWISPVLPMQGALAKHVMGLITPIFETHGFEVPVTFTLLNERSMVAVFNILYDKTVDGETSRAAACYDASMEALMKEGYVPYRVGPRGMPKLVADDTFWTLARRLKQTFDPAGIIAPGRYIPS